MGEVKLDMFDEVRAACQMEPSVWAWLRMYQAMYDMRGSKSKLVEQVIPYVEAYVSRWPEDVSRPVGSYPYAGTGKGAAHTLRRISPSLELTHGTSFHVYQRKVSQPGVWTQYHRLPAFQNMRKIVLAGPNAHGDAVSRNICGTKIRSLQVLYCGDTTDRQALSASIDALNKTGETDLTQLVASPDIIRGITESSLESTLYGQIKSLGIVSRPLDATTGIFSVAGFFNLDHLDLSYVGDVTHRNGTPIHAVSSLVGAAGNVRHLSLSSGAFRSAYGSSVGREALLRAGERALRVEELTVVTPCDLYSAADTSLELLNSLWLAPKVTRLNIRSAPERWVDNWKSVRFGSAGSGKQHSWWLRHLLEARSSPIVAAEHVEHLDLSGLGTVAICTEKYRTASASADAPLADPRGIVGVLRANLGPVGWFPGLKQLTLDARIREKRELWAAIVEVCGERGVAVNSVWNNPFET